MPCTRDIERVTVTEDEYRMCLLKKDQLINRSMGLLLVVVTVVDTQQQRKVDGVFRSDLLSRC